jgi:hypothetical protein
MLLVKKIGYEFGGPLVVICTCPMCITVLCWLSAADHCLANAFFLLHSPSNQWCLVSMEIGVDVNMKLQSE